jgi:LacI family transcriptional regulator
MSERGAGKTTIADVARHAGVSTATAGRVLGGYGYSSDAIRERVKESAAALGYRPNLLARSLITGRTRTIGVVAGDVQSPFYASVLRGISDVARLQGIGVVVTNSDERLEREIEAVQLLLEKQVDGLIVAPCDVLGSSHLRRTIESGCPVVQIDRIVKGLDADSVTVDNRSVSRECVADLLRLGHRRIGILAELERWEGGDVDRFMDRVEAGTVEAESLFPSWQRLLGYADAHRAAGVPVDRRLIARVGIYSAGAASAAAARLLSGPDRPTALFPADGLMAAAAMDAITALGLDVPDDLSLICFDDLDWMSFLKPGISAVAQPLTALGETAATLILDRIADGRERPEHRSLNATVAHRGSVAPAR